MKKRFFAMTIVLSVAVLMMSACGGGASSSAQASSAAQPAASAASSSEAPASSTAASVPASAATSAASEAGAQPYDVNELLATLSTAAELGTTVPMEELDLKAGGIDVEMIASFAGAMSQNVAQNGGVVIVIQAKEGMANDLLAQLEAYKQSSVGNPDYTEFENARANTEGARMSVSGDYVIYAVSGAAHENGWAMLDDAIAGLFA